MCPEDQFWWNWWVSIAVALGTISAVLVALFGQAFRAKFFPPRLVLQIARPKGEKIKVQLTWFEKGEPKECWEDARYYHIRVKNTRRWSPANQVQIFLTRVEEPGPDRKFQVTWLGDVPIRWRHQEVFPPSRTIGPAADCDLCSVVKGKSLQIYPLVAPYNLNVKRREKSIFVVSLQARSNEGDSSTVRVQISWDGKWEDGAEEMKSHLIVTKLDKDMA